MKQIIKKIINKTGFDIVKNTTISKKKQGNYISCEETVKAAREQGLSVCDYVEKIWNQKGATQTVIDQMQKVGCFDNIASVLEIGAGTGRYIEKILKQSSEIKNYMSYETAEDWAWWLEETYNITRREPDGYTLKSEADNSIDLIHAHGVFVYLPLIHSFKYFNEMLRVASKNSYIVFDFYPTQYFDIPMINKWIDAKHYYPVVLPNIIIDKLFNKNGFKLINSFDNKHGEGFSKYNIYKRND